MKMRKFSTRRIRRVLSAVLGIGAFGGAVATSDGMTNVFAKQFMDEGTKMEIPKMVYDPVLQMMVDPLSRRPIYEENKEFKMAKVTAGCSDCPKYDEG